MALRRGKGVLLAVDGAARRAEDHLSHPRLARGLEQVEHPQDVGVGVEARVRHAAADVHLRGQMTEDVRPLAADDVRGSSGSGCPPPPGAPPEQVFPAPGGEVVEGQHAVARGEKDVTHVGADEAGAAAHHHLHGAAIRLMPIRRVPSPLLFPEPGDGFAQPLLQPESEAPSREASGRGQCPAGAAWGRPPGAGETGLSRRHPRRHGRPRRIRGWSSRPGCQC